MSQRLSSAAPCPPMQPGSDDTYQCFICVPSEHFQRADVYVLSMTVLGAVHSLFGLAALAFGTTVMLRGKGTGSHRRLGWAYVASMAGLLTTSFLIYRLFGRFGPFHALAVVGAVTLLGGVLPAWRRRPPDGWLPLHYHFMGYSYAGLVAATAAEIAVRLPGARLGPGAFWGSAAVFAVAAPVIHLNARRMIARFAGPARPRPARPGA